MVTVRLLETLALLAAALVAIRRAQPASPPYGRRMAWIGLLLLLQLGVLDAFVAFQSRSLWGTGAGQMVGPAFITQVLRILLLFAATSAWLGLIRGEIQKRWQWVMGLCVLAMGWGSGGAPISGAIVLGIALNQMKWIEQLSGWRRALAFIAVALLLVAVSFVPIVTIANGASRVTFSLTPRVWPPPLLLGELSRSAAAELSLIRPLDRAVQALVDLMRVQLVVVALKLLFLPIRLEGMSLKRRFTVNYILVRTVPTILTGIMFAGLAYLVIGYVQLERIRAAFERTLARSGTVAAVLAEDSVVRRGTLGPDQVAAATRWLGQDGAGARITIRKPAAPGAALDSLADASGLALLDDELALAARRPIPGAGAVEVSVPLDSAYLARVMRPIGGELEIRTQGNLFVGPAGVRLRGDSSWTRRAVIARSPKPGAPMAREPHWYLGRRFMPIGDWSRDAGGASRGAVELNLSTTMTELVRSLFISLGGLYNATIVTLGILLLFGVLFSIVDSIAVRAGRSIIQAVVDDATALRTAAEQFGSGQLDYRLPVRGQEEFGVVAASFNQMAGNLERQREELKVAERIEEDLAVARQIQQRFLPQRAPAASGLDAAGMSLPSREVGGDLFDWFAHADGSLGFALGDVSGKSVPAALLMSNVLASLRAHAMLRVELAESLERVNQLIADQVEPGRFVTLFYAEIDPTRAALRYVSAGHNPPLLMRASGNVEWLRDGGLPLGIQADVKYTASQVALERGDALVVYSDGVTESEGSMAPGSSDAQPPLFGEERLLDVVRAQRGAAAGPMLDTILSAVRAFAGGEPQSDDVTLLVVRRT